MKTAVYSTKDGSCQKYVFFFVNEKLFGKRGNDGESLINRTILKDITLAQF